MSLIRWALSILAFPVGGWIAIQPFGAVTNPVNAAVAGAIAGAVIGAAQAFALGRGFRWRWLAATMVGMSIGSAGAAAMTSSATTVGALALSGLATGLVVGAAQGAAARWGWRLIALWASTVALSWAAAWVVSANVIGAHDAHGFIIFGLSGAALVTAATALVLRRSLGSRATDAADSNGVSTAEPIEATR